METELCWKDQDDRITQIYKGGLYNESPSEIVDAMLLRINAWKKGESEDEVTLAIEKAAREFRKVLEKRMSSRGDVVVPIAKQVAHYPCWFRVIFGEEAEAINKVMRSDYLHGEVFASTVTGPIDVEGRDFFCINLIFNCNNNFSDITADVIAHEAVHAAEFVFEFIDESNYRGEHLAYLVQYFVSEVMKCLPEDHFNRPSHE